jgi:hypothetical protein
MAKERDTRARIIEILEDTPLVSYACKKAGISRATYYRWMNDDLKFAEQVERAITMGRESSVEIGEAVIIKKMREGDLGATKYFLSFNSNRYTPRRPLPAPPSLAEEERRLLIRAMDILLSRQPLEKEQWVQIKRALQNTGLLDEEGRATE